MSPLLALDDPAVLSLSSEITLSSKIVVHI